MDRITRLVVAFSFTLCWLEGFSQNLSNRGKDFWVAYGHHQFMEQTVTGSLYNSQEMVLYFSAEEAANVTVTINGTGWVRNYSIPAGTVIASEFIPKAGASDCRMWDVAPPAGNGGEGLFTRGIHITSDVPIVAYAHTFGSASSGATMLMPVETWGYYYVSLNSRQVYQSNCFSWAYVVAQHDNTVVEITPTVWTRNNQPAGSTLTVTLNRGQMYQVIGGNPTNSTSAFEVSGTKFRSVANAAGECYPIAVFSGSSRTSNPMTCGSGGGDNDNQQLFPSQAWGKRYLTSPTSRSTAPNQFMTNSYKVLVKDPTTQVRRNGTLLTGLTPNNYYFFESSTADLITADKPVMVAQFMTGGGCMGGGLGDPEMIYISPLEQGIKRIGFFRNNAEKIEVNYVTLIVPNGGTGVSSLKIDGIPLSSLPTTVYHTYPHPQMPSQTVVVRRWSGFAAYPATAPGQCIVESDSAFTAITYGLGSVESYGYNAGTMINNLSAISSIQNTLDPNTVEHPFTCAGSPIKLSALVAYPPTRMEWKLSTLGSALTPNADVIVDAPVPVGTVTVNGLTYYKYTLPGNYVFNVADTFEIPIINTHPSIERCDHKEELKIRVIVKPTPVSDFTFLHTGCTLDTVYFAGPPTTTDGYTLNAWNWTFPGPITATGQNVKQILAPGVHDILLSVVTNEGCASDTTKSITVQPKPVTSFTSLPQSICEGGNITFTPTSSYFDPTALNGWYWDFGNNITLTSPSGIPQTNAYPDYGTYEVKQVAKFGNLCISDTARAIVTIYANPRMGFNYPVGCLPPGGLVQFTSTATTPDGQLFSNHNWNFGDGNATPANPNTSTVQDPSHIYTTYGTYNVSYSATTVNGCTADTIIQAVLNVRPELAFSPLPSVCENVAGTISVATATVTNAVPGTGVYRGTATDAAGNFSPSLAGPGNHTIWYVYTSSAGCADSLSQNIFVHAKPNPDFSFPNTGCLATNGQVQFTNTSTIADAQTMTWAWNFNDPNANAGNPNTSTLQHPVHNFGEGSFPIRLTATSSNGCINDTTINASFAVTPALTYAALPAVCENITSVSVATAAVTNAVTGSGTYSGTATSATGTFNPSEAGPGQHTITYSYTTTGGCTATIPQTIFVHARPHANFTYTNGCLPTTGLVQFTNTSTIADAQMMTWAWNFNDPLANAGNPNTSTSQNPTHNYTEGTFNINLSVASSNGCLKDTTIVATFAVTPELAFPPLTNVCQNPAAGPANVALASVVNGVAGTGVYSGPGTTAAGLFDPNVAGPGVHTINFTFTSRGGCTQTIPQTIEVYPRPTASFTVSNNNSACLGQAVTIAGNSTISSGAISTWNWNLGNNSTASYSNQNPFTITYATANNYTVQLVAVSDRGCFSEPFSQVVGVHPLPLVNFTLPSSICMPGGNATFSNQSTVPDNSTLGYQWNFGDASGTSTATNPTYVYAASGSYNVVLTATSAFGCTAQATKTLDNFYDKPIALFNVNPQELCQGTDNVFRDGSTAPNSTLQSWNWNFDDGTSSTSTDPVKRFNTPGVYDVSLIVRNAAGCTSDPFILPITVHLQPVIDAGRSFVVPQGTTIQFAATANSAGLTFNWSPATGLSDPTVLNPTLVANQDQSYKLTATGDFGCTATDIMNVKILKPVNVPNIFTPNGDNIHDRWMVPNLSDYPGCTVEVFNRYGQQVYYSVGYNVPWDGTYNGKPMPVGAYYYVIQLQNGFKPLTGSVTIVR